ncbi:BRCA1-associated protein [Contarinia nasturtii]|uniref:BRCA1-associated protein n=1 Tax=Contarinia nasturtii TaxID=265458 RepID=UPI0012D448CC|nr:BRCA1-associated protein [Contarinia nasturtii]
MSIFVSLCHIKFEIDLSAAMDGTNNSEGAAAVCLRQNPHNDQRQPRKIIVENFSNKQKDNGVNDEKGILPSGSRETTPMTEEIKITIDEKGFFSGNPFVEVTKGIIHIYKKNERTEVTDGVSKMLCLLAVPATLNCHDILNFVAPCHSTIQHVRIIRDGTPNQFMVLLDYKATNHTYALQLGTNRVWDYAGDNFVHRLLQSKGDGKLVAHTQSPNAESADSDEKIDSLQLEFTYALTSQLQKQREYYEEKLARLESKIEAESKQFQVKIDTFIRDYTDLDAKYGTLRKEKNGMEKKLAQLSTKLTNYQKELNDEREMIKALRSNQSEWEAKCSQLEEKYKKYQTEKETEIGELKDEIRDLMFYMEAQNAVANSHLKDEIDDTSITISPPSNPEASGSKKTRRKKK